MSEIIRSAMLTHIAVVTLTVFLYSHDVSRMLLE